MGIFSRNEVSPSREKSRKKRAEICSTYFNREILRIQQSINDDLMNNELEVSEFAKRKVSALEAIGNHTVKFMTQWDQEYVSGYPVLTKWEYFADVVHYSKRIFVTDTSEKIEVEEIIDQVRNLNEITKNGGLVTMPDANLVNSKRYRGYLSANSFSGRLGWDWMNHTENEKNFVDNQLALLIGDFMTEIFDKFGLNNETGFSGVFSAALLNSWNTSTARSELATNHK